MKEVTFESCMEAAEDLSDSDLEILAYLKRRDIIPENVSDEHALEVVNDVCKAKDVFRANIMDKRNNRELLDEICKRFGCETEHEKLIGGLQAVKQQFGENDERYLAIVHACGISPEDVK